MNEDLPILMWPDAQVQIRTKGGLREIHDPVRKRWLRLTPEEWVRQHFVSHLVQQWDYKLSSIAVEKSIELNGIPKRFDALIYVNAKPVILVECKAPEVKLTESVFHQACRYNTAIGAPVTILTNGLSTIIALIDFKSGKVGYLREIPHRSNWQ